MPNEGWSSLGDAGAGAGAGAGSVSAAICVEVSDPARALVATAARVVGAATVGTVAIGAVGVRRMLSTSVSVCYVGAVEVAAGMVLDVLNLIASIDEDLRCVVPPQAQWQHQGRMEGHV